MKHLRSACEFVMRCDEGKLTFVGNDPLAMIAVANCNKGIAKEADYELLSRFAIFDESVATAVAEMTLPELLIA